MPYFTYNHFRIHYREMGEQHNPLLLILPGNTASSAHHSGELNFFSKLGFHAVSLDFPGTGQSDRLTRPWPLDWYQQNAAVCVGLMDWLNKPQAVVCGTSGGAIVALWMAILYPQKTAAVISDSIGIKYATGVLQKSMEERGQRTTGQILFWSDGHGTDWQDVVDADTEMLLAIESKHAPTGSWTLNAGRLNEIRCPVLFSGSLVDPLIPQLGPQLVEMSQQVAGSWVFAVNQGDHPLMWSVPAAFQATAKEFLISTGFITR